MNRFLIICAAILPAASLARAQYPAGQFQSPNVKLVAHVPLGAGGTVMDIEMEQELSRPFVYVSRSDYGKATVGRAMGFDVLEIRNPSRPRVIRRWRIENQDLGRNVR